MAVWRGVPWLLLFAVATQAEPCQMNSGDWIRGDCRGENNSSFRISGWRSTNVIVKCQSGNVECADIPSVDIGDGGQLRDMGITNCRGLLLPCLLHAANGSSVGEIKIENLVGELAPQHLEGTGVRLLNIDGTSFTEIPTETLRVLPSLRSLVIRSSNLVLVPNAFQGSEQLESLTLALDNITDLPAGAFRGLNHLKKLQLWRNNITHISNGSFEGLAALEVLDLQNNLLIEIETSALAATPRLRELFLDYSSLTSIPAGLFTGRHMEKIQLQHNQVHLIIDDRAFADLPSLKKVDLFRCPLKSLQANTFQGSSKITQLILSQNELGGLPSTLFQDQTALKELDLSYNAISSLPEGVFRSLRSLEDLDLSTNRIEVLPDNLFSTLGSLKTFKIEHNSLKTIAPNALIGAESLVSVSMLDNEIALPHDDDKSQSPFRTFMSLETLSLSQNRIRNIFEDWRKMVNLTTLDLSWNKIQNVTNEDLLFQNKEIKIDLQHNLISRVLLEGVQPKVPGLWTPRGSAIVTIASNPLVCDCTNYNFILMLNGGTSPTLSVDFYVEDAKCASPRSKWGQWLRNIKPEDLSCDSQ